MVGGGNEGAGGVSGGARGASVTTQKSISVMQKKLLDSERNEEYSVIVRSVSLTGHETTNRFPSPGASPPAGSMGVVASPVSPVQRVPWRVGVPAPFQAYASKGVR